MRRPPRSTQSRSSAASDVYKRQFLDYLCHIISLVGGEICYTAVFFYYFLTHSRICAINTAVLLLTLVYTLSFGKILFSCPRPYLVDQDVKPILACYHEYGNPSGHAYSSIVIVLHLVCLLYTSPSPRDRQKSRMPSSA
eukprot:TRINITY_DN21322_c0_g1_i1.p2 TRINITY_DN21322_c0_g1~~TRINITY_DN21322_c0_g1_i1.p2  ORF type:complete len:139 (-),score=42.32 TRINITY_DN21322_c0_g1_i1:9-425(-)